jgi:hypothetical protein
LDVYENPRLANGSVSRPKGIARRQGRLDRFRKLGERRVVDLADRVRIQRLKKKVELKWKGLKNRGNSLPLVCDGFTAVEKKRKNAEKREPKKAMLGQKSSLFAEEIGH